MFYKMWTEQNRLFCKSQLLDMLTPPKKIKKKSTCSSPNSFTSTLEVYF